jgi:hypothetical protein
MKKIINGKRYDTEKAICIGGYQYSIGGNFNYISEYLYITPRSKSYFLAGEGGAMTKYAKRASDNSYCGGEKIIPLTENDAFVWAQEYLQSEEIEKHFSHMIEDA